MHGWLRLVTTAVCCALTVSVINGPAAVAEGRKAPVVPRHRVDKVEPFSSVEGRAVRGRADRAMAATAAAARRAVAEQAAVNRREAADAAADRAVARGASLSGVGGSGEGSAVVQTAAYAVEGAGAARVAAEGFAVVPAAAGPAGSGAGSGSGDYSATSLSPSSTWSGGGSSGSFTWSYPLRVPSPAAGPAPSLGLSYDSGSVDGRLPTTNNQPSWVGEGFSLSAESYVERSYGSCDDDGHKDKFDLCWKNDNATLVLNGSGGELVKDDESGVWRLRNDDASKVELLTGADNGARGGEHWQVTTGDGTRYVFGLHKLPGADADTRTNSVFTVPVYGDDAGEPCHGDTFAASSCTQAWRWNLDYVVDTHGNAATYWYAREGNYYAKNGDADPGTAYVRGGYLKRIEYGQRADALFGSSAAYRVVFSVAERCLASGDGCAELTKSTQGNWPDVPFDSICAAGKACTGQTGPAFFTRKRLTGVRSEVWDAAASTPGYRKVDSWALTQVFLDPGDIGSTADQVLWLSAVRQTNTVDGAVATPPVRFAHTFLPNRVDATDDILPLTKPRISMITTETGAVVTVNYSNEQCVRGSRMPSAPDSNTMRCFPVYWTPNGVEDPVLDWFHKYVVTHVMVDDPTGGSPTMQTDYAYAGGGAWHHADDPISKVKHRTWSQWRGFERVTTTTGDPDDSVRSRTVSVFLRGMHGDTQADGSKRSVKVTGIHAPAITDADQYSGQERESVTYNGAGGAEVSGSVTTPWSRQTASHVYPGYTAKAFLVRTGSVQDRTVITSGASTSTRTRTTTTTYDDYGMPVTEQDNGDDAVTGDETCTRTWYARNPAKGLTALESRVQTLAVACADVGAASLPATSATSGDVISDMATVYDTTTWSASQTPTRGEARWTGRVKSYTGTTPSWQTQATTTYDALGRPLTATDTAGNTTTTTVYTPTGAGPMTAIKVTDAKSHTVTTTYDPAWNKPVKVVDANNKLTEVTYDGLGRTTQVWLPTASRAIGRPPNTVYDYELSATKPSWVSTATIRTSGTTYNTSYTLYDAHLRSRQVQSPSPIGGRVIAETFYDDRGLTGTTYADVYDDTSDPNGTLMATVNAQAPSETRTVYDGAQRQTTSTFLVAGVTKWSTTTSYTGDSVASTAVTGGSAIREINDVFGRVIERRQYSGTSPTASTYLKTSFTYTPDGEQESVTGPDGARWTYGYDLFGRQTKVSDPDKGTTTTSYTALDQVDATTDAAGNTLLYSYDELGRKTGQWTTTRSDATKQAAWTYDTLAKGQPTSATRYVGGVDGSAYTTKVTAYDNAYRATKQQLLLPTTDPLVTAGVPATLSFTNGYNQDGTLQLSTQPAVAGLPLEALTPKYNALGLPTTLAGTSGYVQNTVYSPLGQVDQVQLGQATQATNPKQVWITNTYEPGTRRLTRANVTDATNPWMAQDLNYSYDQAGNVTAISDPTTLGGTGKADHQCFGYDGYQRMTEAWTPATAECTTSKRTAAALGGVAPYWTSYAYNDAGLRTTETQHAVAGNTVTAYGYDSTKTHQLTKTTTTKPDGTTTTTGYSYDALGNTTTRPGTQGTQTLTWDAEGHLATSAEPAKGSTPAKNTNYVYDPDGNLLIRRATGDGDTILYLGATEVRLTVKGTTKTLSGTRYYAHAGQTVAVRTATKGTTGTKLTWQVADHHGTAHLAIAADTQAVTKRYTTPFGAPRGTNPAWVDDKTFLGKPTDTTTGLTHIGAREYDPLIGRFISVDPVMNTAKPLSLNGYTYTENNPVTIADPTGLDGSCPYPSGSAQFKACNSYASSTNSALTTKERKQRTERYHKQVIKDNYNACRSGQGGCGGGGGPEASKPQKKKQHWWDSKVWNKTASFVQKVSPWVSAVALVAAVVLTMCTPVGWFGTLIAVIGYAAIVSDAAAAAVGTVEGLKAANLTGEKHDWKNATWNVAGAALSAAGVGVAAKGAAVGRSALKNANQAAGARAVQERDALAFASKNAPFANKRTVPISESRGWRYAGVPSLQRSAAANAILTGTGVQVTGTGLWVTINANISNSTP